MKAAKGRSVRAVAGIALSLGMLGTANADANQDAAPTPSASVAPSSSPASVASAAPALPQSNPALDRALMQSIAQRQVELQRLGAETRAQMLSALSPAHRALVANIFGQLIIAPNPDPVLATRQVDAMLSPGEREAILRFKATEISQLQAMGRQMDAQVQSAMTPAERSTLHQQYAQQYARVKLNSSINRLSSARRDNVKKHSPERWGRIPLASCCAR